MKPYILLSVLLLSALISCKKKVEPSCKDSITDNFINDTIYPSDYLMAYPGSWWEYSNGYVDSCTHWESIPFSKISNSTCTSVQYDYHVLPVLSSLGPVHYDSKVYKPGSSAVETQLAPLYEAASGVLFSKTFEFNGGEQYVTVTSFGHHDSISINGTMYYDVMETQLHEEFYFYQTGSGTNTRSIFFFERNTGMVARYREMNGSPMNADTLNVVNYYIAPH